MHRGVVFTGVRHGLIIKQIVDLGLLDESERPIIGEQQGFIDNTGLFWLRAQARQIAIKSRQIDPDHGVLYSEDLW